MDRLRAWTRRAALEEATLLASLLKWTALATLVGILGGAATALFLKTLGWAVGLAHAVSSPLWLLPPGFALSALLVARLAPQATGHGTEKIIEAVHLRWGRIPLAVAPVKLVATVLTIATGGSVGKEGPAAQIGAALASGVASLLWLRRHDRRTLVICGISAGFASIFGTPIAGSIFGVEVLVMGSVLYEVLYPSFIAGIVAYQTATALGVTYFHHSIAGLPAPTGPVLLKVVAAGILFGLVAIVLIETLGAVDVLARRVRLPRWALAATGGAAMVVVALGASPIYLGLGVDTIEAAVSGATVPGDAFIVKTVATAISLGTGGSGGIITPVFFVGATAGNALAPWLGFDRGTLGGIGMVSLLAAATNSPIAASIMSIEMFGPAIGPLAAVACMVSFLIVGHRSVYGSQMLGVAKSRSIRIPRDVSLDSLDALVIHRRRRYVVRLMARRVRRLMRRWL